MKKTAKFLLVPTLAFGAAVALAGPAAAATAATDDGSYQATLSALNGSNGSGTVMVKVSGDQATVTEKVSGLAGTFNGAPYPHVQHIHIGATGMCPTMDADTNGDGVISTTEGGPAYGGIGTTLSTSGNTSPSAGTDLTVAGMGSDFTYERTFTLNAETAAALKAGTGVVVVHGLDPATLSQAAQDAPSDLVPSLPLAATSPALCGTLTASQMDMPVGGAQTGAGTTATGNDIGMIALGGGLVLAAGGVVVARRRAAVAGR